MLDIAADGPVLPDSYALAWVYALIVPVVLGSLALLLLYFVIKRAVVAGIREARVTGHVTSSSSTE